MNGSNRRDSVHECEQTSSTAPDAINDGTNLHDDPQLSAAIDAYLLACETGPPPDIVTFVASYPHIAPALRECLDGLALLQQSARLVESTSNGLDRLSNHELDLSIPLGDFRLIRELGRGGMGIVYEAEQLSLARRVALKILPFAALLQAKQLQRFQNEALAAASLRHPHIVGVYTVGFDRGIHYYAMELIDGQSLAAALVRRTGEREGNDSLDPSMSVEVLAPRHATDAHQAETSPHDILPTVPLDRLTTQRGSQHREYFRHTARLVVQAAEALEYAHQRGIVHRDIKPANLLIDGTGEHLWITDFGLATPCTDHSLTATGDLIGTLRYMSPEQARGDPIVDQRTDVYSLGVTLYELICGRPAIGGTDRASLLQQVIHQSAIAPRKHEASIPFDLETIILKAIAKAPDDRYRTAQALADDLRRFIERRPIQGRRATIWWRSWRWCQRSPAFASLVLSTSLLLGLVALTTTILLLRERNQFHAAIDRADEAEWQQYVSDMHSAMAAWEQSDVGRAVELLERHRPPSGRRDLRGFEWNYLWRKCHDDRLKVTINETVWSRAAAYSNSGQFVATGNEAAILRLWLASNGSLVREFHGHKASISRVAFSPDDRYLVSADINGDVRVWSLEQPDSSWTLSGHTDNVMGLVFSSDGKQLASGGADETVRIWNMPTGDAVRRIQPKMRHHTPTMPIPPWTDHRLWMFGWDGTLRQYDTDTQQETTQIDRRELQRIHTLTRISRDGRLGATGGGDGVIRLFDPNTGRDLEALGTGGPALRSVTFSPKGDAIASCDAHGKVWIWDLQERKTRATIRSHAFTIWPPMFSPDGRQLCTLDGNHALKIWDITSDPASGEILEGHGWLAHTVAYSPDGRKIASGGAEAGGGVVILWDAETGSMEGRFEGHTDAVWSVAFSPDGKELASAGEDGTLRLWDLTSPEKSRVIAPDKSISTHWVRYSPDGRELITSEAKGTIRMWDRATGQQVNAVQLGESTAERPAFSADGRWLAAGIDKSIVLLEYPSLKTIRRLTTVKGFGHILAVSPDRSIIASCKGDKSVILSTPDGTLVGALNHPSEVNCLGFSPDGRALVTGDNAFNVHLWDVERRTARATFRGHERWVIDIAFSPDGKTIASTGDDGTVRLWRSDMGAGGRSP